jgi:hypothetical protein
VAVRVLPFHVAGPHVAPLRTDAADVVDDAFEAFLTDLATAAPAVLAGVVFLVVAGACVEAATWLVRSGLRTALPGETPVYRQFVATVVSIFRWFAVLLGFLSIVGLVGIAAALGTATGFVALGVS